MHFVRDSIIIVYELTMALTNLTIPPCGVNKPIVIDSYFMIYDYWQYRLGYSKNMQIACKVRTEKEFCTWRKISARAAHTKIDRHINSSYRSKRSDDVRTYYYCRGVTTSFNSITYLCNNLHITCYIIEFVKSRLCKWVVLPNPISTSIKSTANTNKSVCGTQRIQQAAHTRH